MHLTQNIQRVQQATLKEWKYYCFQRKLYNGWKLICLVSWPNEALTYLQAPMELSGTLEGSLQLMNILEHSIQFYVQEYTRDLWNSLESLGLFSRLPPQCRDVWTSLGSLEASTLFPPMAQCRWFQEFSEASHLLYKPMGRVIYASYDTMLALPLIVIFEMQAMPLNFKTQN